MSVARSLAITILFVFSVPGLWILADAIRQRDYRRAGSTAVFGAACFLAIGVLMWNGILLALATVLLMLSLSLWRKAPDPPRRAD